MGVPAVHVARHLTVWAALLLPCVPGSIEGHSCE